MIGTITNGNRGKRNPIVIGLLLLASGPTFTADRARAHRLPGTVPGVGRAATPHMSTPLCVVARRTTISLAPGGIPNWVSAEHGRFRSSAHTANCSTMLLLE